MTNTARKSVFSSSSSVDSFMSSSSPKTSGNYPSNACYQQPTYNTTSTLNPYSLGPSPHLHHQQQQQQSLVNSHGPTLSPTSLSVVYANNQQQMPTGSSASSFNVLQTRYQNDQINEKASNGLVTTVNNGQQQQQQQSIPNNAATLAAANTYRRNHFNACAKPPYR